VPIPHTNPTMKKFLEDFLKPGREIEVCVKTLQEPPEKLLGWRPVVELPEVLRYFRNIKQYLHFESSMQTNPLY